MEVPSNVTSLLCFMDWRRLRSRRFSWSFSSMSERSSGSGSTYTQLLQPSRMARWPSQFSSKSTAVRAGMFSARARMAVWLLADPRRVTKPRSLPRSSWTA